MWVGSSVFEWWWKQIKISFPWLKLEKTLPSDALIIDIKKFSSSSDGMRPIFAGNILARRKGTEQPIAILNESLALPENYDALPEVGLRLPPRMSLHREVVLPPMGDSDLKLAIGAEMDRLTPFSVRDVVWGIYGLTREKQKLKFSLLVVPRVGLEPLLRLLTQLGLHPSFIESGFGRIQLGNRDRKITGKLQAGLYALCCTMLVAIISIPLVEQQRRISSIDAQLKGLMPVQHKLSMLRSEMETFDSYGLIGEAAQKNGDVLQVLAELTGALPNGTWLNQITLVPNQLAFSGQSNNSAELISALTVLPGFYSPSFIGPITRIDGSSGETFSIQVAISH